MAVFARNLFYRRPGSKRRKSPGSGTAWVLEHSPLLRWAILALLAGGAVLLISWRGKILELPPEGAVCNRDITATVAFSFPDRTRTEELRRLAADRQPFAYGCDSSILQGQLAELGSFLEHTAGQLAMPAWVNAQTVSEAERLCREIAAAGILSPDVHQALRESGNARIARSGKDGVRIIPVSETYTPASAEDEIRRQLEENPKLPQDTAREMFDFLAARIRPNLAFDQTLTAKLRREAGEAVDTVITQVRRGDRIVEAGQAVTPAVIARLRAYQEEQIRHSPPAGRLNFALGTAILVCLVLGAFLLALSRGCPTLLKSNSSLFLLVLAGLFSLGLTRILVQAWWYLDPAVSSYLRFVSPIPGAIFIVCLLLGPASAAILALTLGSLGAMIATFDAGVFVAWTLSGLAAAYVIQEARRRGDILRAGLRVALISIATVAALGLMGGLGGEVILKQAVGAALGSLICALAAISLLGIVEVAFRRSSGIGLLELSDMNHPLLREMMLRAPGTHHHSLLVSSLAEVTAEAIGANPLLCRVGALFHDVGKIAKPDYFVENIFAGPNSHDRLIPSMSSLILISHVKEGVDLAVRHRLDRRIVEIIQQHHGTSLISYFFDRAERSRQLKFDVLEKDFRYPGPRPQSPEAAIVMLADAVEAASVAMERPTPARIEHLVRSIIQERFADSQLDESGLSLNDLREIAEALTRALTARFHSRVKYPGADGEAPPDAPGGEGVAQEAEDDDSPG